MLHVQWICNLYLRVHTRTHPLTHMHARTHVGERIWTAPVVLAISSRPGYVMSSLPYQRVMGTAADPSGA
jgi:hypothetical protein